MQFSSWKSTIPFEYCTMAPGAGHAFRHPGSAQCMQPSLRISHSRSPLGFSYSAKRITVQDASVRSGGLSYTPTLVPISSRRSFHSMQATWQALQPMHLVVSMSLATVPAYDSRTPGGAVVVAERRTMSRDCRAICELSPAASELLHLDEKRLEFGRLRVAITDHGRERVGQEARLGEAREAPVNGNADRMDRLAVGRQRPQALGDYRHGLDEAAIRGDLHAIPGSDAELFRQAFSDFDELLRLQNRVQPHVLCPVMEVLRQAVSGRDVRELRDLAERRTVVLEHAGSGVAQCLLLSGAQRVAGERALERLVVLGEGAFGQVPAPEEARHPLGVHDERTHAECGILVRLVVGHIRTGPRRAIPGDELAIRIEGLAARVAGGAVVHHAAICRPRIRPVEGLTDAGGIGVIPPRHEIAVGSPGAAVEPASGKRAAVVS